MPSDVFKLSSRRPAVASPVVPGPRAQSRLPNAECRSILDQVLRQTVISRLRLAHPQTEVARHDPAGPGRRLAVHDDHVEGFVQVLRFDDQKEVDRCAEWLIEEEFGIDGLLLDLVPSVEIQLLAMADEPGDHADLTLAQWRLAELVERLGLRFQATAVARRHDHRALLIASEPAAARLRLLVAAELLNHAGWDVWSDAESPLSELCEVVHCDWFALVLVASEDAGVETLAGVIRALRRASVNPGLRVLVLSAGLVRRPDRLVRVGADAAAADLRQLAVQAERLRTLMPPIA